MSLTIYLFLITGLICGFIYYVSQSPSKSSFPGILSWILFWPIGILALAIKGAISGVLQFYKDMKVLGNE